MATVGTVATASVAVAAGTSAGIIAVKNLSGNALTSGDSATSFTLDPGVGAACSGDTATGSYKVQSFIVPSTYTLSALTFTGGVPDAVTPGDAAFQLFDTTGSPYSNKNTAVTTGFLTNLPTLQLGSALTAGQLPAGDYWLGYACTNGVAGPTQLDRYWAAQIRVATSLTDAGPVGISWTLLTASAPTVTSVVGNSRVMLRWTAPSYNGGLTITNYVVQQRVGSSGAWSDVNTNVATTSLLVSGLTNATGYQYRVIAQSSAGLGLPAVTSTLTPNPPAAAVAAVTVKHGGTAISSGDSSTLFSLDPGASAACAADSATGGYRVQSFMVPGAYNLSSLTFNNVGPVAATVGDFVQPLFANASAWVNKTTAVTTGYLTNLPTFDFGVFSSGAIPAGIYWVGYACTNGPASATQLDSFWATRITVQSSLSDTGPAGIAWNVTAVPGAPTITTVTPGDSQVTVSWSAPVSDGGAAVTAYAVQKRLAAVGITPAGSWADVNTNVVGTSLVVTGLTNLTAYEFRVAAKNVIGTGAYSSTSSAATPASLPGAPSITTVTPGNAQVSLAWSAPASDGGATVTAYVVQKRLAAVGSTPAGAWTDVDTNVAGTSLVVTGLTNGTAYQFQVAATNVIGTGTYSAASASTTPRTVATATRSVVLAPYSGQVLLTWTAPLSNGGAAVTAYRVERSTDNVHWTTISTTASASTRSYLATGLTNGKKYYFRVAAVNVAGNGGYSTVTSTTPKAVPSAPGKPTLLASSKKVRLSWTAPASKGGSAITAYRVQRSTDGVTWTTVTSAAPISRVYTVLNLTNGKKYYFRVAAINSIGVGPWSGVASATPH